MRWWRKTLRTALALGSLTKLKVDMGLSSRYSLCLVLVPDPDPDDEDGVGVVDEVAEDGGGVLTGKEDDELD